jgi:hypothetical protein
MGILVTFDSTVYAKRLRQFMQDSAAPAMQEAVLFMAASARLSLRETTPAYLQNPVPWTLSVYAYTPGRHRGHRCLRPAAASPIPPVRDL